MTHHAVPRDVTDILTHGLLPWKPALCEMRTLVETPKETRDFLAEKVLGECVYYN